MSFLNNLKLKKKNILILLIVVGCVLFFSKGTPLSSLNKFSVEKEQLKYKFTQNINSVLGTNQKALEVLLEKNKPLEVDQLELAQLYVKQFRITSSEIYLDKAQELIQKLNKLPNLKNNFEFVKLQIQLLVFQHRYKESLALLEKIKNENDFGFLQLRASIYMAQYRFTEAFSDVSTIVRLNPNMSTATQKALLFSYTGQDELAFYFFKRALTLEDLEDFNQSLLTRAQFAQFMIKKTEYSTALNIIDSALEVNSEHIFLNLIKAQVYIQQKQYQKAYELQNQIFTKTKDPLALVHLLQSSVLLKDQNKIQVYSSLALDEFKNQVAKNKFGHALDLAESYFLVKKYKEAIEIAQADQTNKISPRGDLILAKSYVALKKFDDARFYIERQLAFGSNEPSLYFLMTTVLNQSHQVELKKLFNSKLKKETPHFNEESLCLN